MECHVTWHTLNKCHSFLAKQHVWHQEQMPHYNNKHQKGWVYKFFVLLRMSSILTDWQVWVLFEVLHEFLEVLVSMPEFYFHCYAMLLF